MHDTLPQGLAKFTVATIVKEIKCKVRSSANYTIYRHAHPSLNPRNGLQTVEFPLEVYEAIARRATQLLKNAGFDITVEYDARDGNREFVAQLV